MQLYVCQEMSRKNWLCVMEIKKWWKHVRSFLAAICYSWKAYHFKCISETRTFSLWLPPHPFQFCLVLFLSILPTFFSIRYTLCIIMWNHIIQFVNLPFRSDSCHSLFTCFMPIKTWKRTTFVGDSGISADAPVPVRQSWQISDGVQSFRLPNSVWPFAWIQEEVMLWLNSNNMNYFLLFSYANFHSYSTKMETFALIIYCILLALLKFNLLEWCGLDVISDINHFVNMYDLEARFVAWGGTFDYLSPEMVRLPIGGTWVTDLCYPKAKGFRAKWILNSGCLYGMLVHTNAHVFFWTIGYYRDP